MGWCVSAEFFFVSDTVLVFGLRFLFSQIEYNFEIVFPAVLSMKSSIFAFALVVAQCVAASMDMR